VHVVRHEDVGVDSAIEPVRHVAQCIEITAVVLLGVEAGGAVVAALDDVPGDPAMVRRARRGIVRRSVIFVVESAMLPEVCGALYWPLVPMED
jgi:uncharacterized membrane protein